MRNYANYILCLAFRYMQRDYTQPEATYGIYNYIEVIHLLF